MDTEQYHRHFLKHKSDWQKVAQKNKELHKTNFLKDTQKSNNQQA